MVPKSCCGSGPAVPARPDLVSELRVKLGTPHPLLGHGPHAMWHNTGQCGHLVPTAHLSAPHVHSWLMCCPPGPYQG